MEFTELIKIKQINNVTCLLDVFQEEPEGPGVVIVSAHVLCFESSYVRFQLLHQMIHSVIQEADSCTIRYKDFHCVTLFVQEKQDCQLLVQTLQLLSTIGNIELTLPFYCKPKSKTELYQSYDELMELEWLEFPPCGWKISQANALYQITEFYSEIVVIPTGWEDVMLKLSECRIEGRIPRPTYIYKHPTREKCMLITVGELKETNTLQYKILDKEYKDLDCLYMQHVLECTGAATIVTERHFKDKLMKRDYEGWEHLKLHLPTEDLKSCIVEMCKKESWISGNKKWLDLVWFMLNTTDTLINHIVEAGRSVFLEVYPRVLSSLLQLSLESRYRTNYGLIMCLLRKDWLHAGYKFSAESADNSCAEFLLFLHCVRQMTIWFPTVFQYSEELLLELHSHANASRYGDFLCDSECERAAHLVDHRTDSLWEGVFARGAPPQHFINPAYKPVTGVIRPRVTAPETVAGWGRVFLKHSLLDKEFEKVTVRRHRLYKQLKET